MRYYPELGKYQRFFTVLAALALIELSITGVATWVKPVQARLIKPVSNSDVGMDMAEIMADEFYSETHVPTATALAALPIQSLDPKREIQLRMTAVSDLVAVFTYQNDRVVLSFLRKLAKPVRPGTRPNLNLAPLQEWGRVPKAGDDLEIVLTFQFPQYQFKGLAPLDDGAKVKLGMLWAILHSQTQRWVLFSKQWTPAAMFVDGLQYAINNERMVFVRLLQTLAKWSVRVLLFCLACLLLTYQLFRRWYLRETDAIELAEISGRSLLRPSFLRFLFCWDLYGLLQKYNSKLSVEWAALKQERRPQRTPKVRQPTGQPTVVISPGPARESKLDLLIGRYYEAVEGVRPDAEAAALFDQAATEESYRLKRGLLTRAIALQLKANAEPVARSGTDLTDSAATA